MDYMETKLASEFVFNNPNIKGTCGCGESFNVWQKLKGSIDPEFIDLSAFKWTFILNIFCFVF